MRQIIRFRWLIFIAWLVATAALFFFAPNLQELVADKGQITVPEGYPSQEAQQLIEEMSSDAGEDTTDAVLVFHDEDGLDQKEKNDVLQAIDQLEENKDELAISDLLVFTDDPAIEEQTVSEDGKTILVPFQVSLANQDIDESRAKIYQTIANIDIEHDLTGERYIEQDIVKNSEEGLKKTEFITVGLILIILFIVFKSFVAPFIPLLTIGISYLAAQGIVSILAETVNFPLSTFTQIFMVAVMFGIGTDYCILLLSRFKEEIARHETITEAVITTYRSGGKTIFFAGLAVLIGFSAIGLSTFSLYQSAVAVAVGVAVVLVALATLVPFFLVMLGNKLFWPFHKNVAHKESRVWGAAGSFAWKRPVWSLLIVAAIILPFLLTYDGDNSYNSLEELGDDYGSVKAFNQIAASFGPGEAMPTSVVLESDHAIDSAEAYEEIATISQELAEMEGVEQVRSATRPAGEAIDDFLIQNQTDLLADGIKESTDGLQEIEDGLQEAASELNSALPQLQEAEDGAAELMQGTEAASAGIDDIRQALAAIQKGIASSAQGAGDIKANVQTIKENLDETIAGNRQLLEGYQAIAEGLEAFGARVPIDADDLDQLIAAMEGAKANITTVRDTALASNPELQQNAEFVQSYATAVGQMDGAIDGLQQMKAQLGQLADAQTQLQTEVIAPLKELNNGFSETIAGQEQLSQGIDEFIAAIEELQSGLNEAANGQEQVVNDMPSLQDGLAEIYGGQEELQAAFADMQAELEQLADGLHEGADGLQQVQDGLSEVQGYLEEFDADSRQPVVIIPEEALENEDFIEGTKPYLSADKTIAKFDIILEHNPYSTEAMNMVDAISDKVNHAKTDTVFADSDPKVGGVSSTNNDLRNISDADYSRTVLLMIAGIFIVLVILLRALVMPLYLIGSLILTYFTSMGVAELIFVQLLGYDGLTWVVSFFSFVMLIALGVDYSIFLMDRLNEYRNGGVKEALLLAMKNMGTVIISAAVILGGTFAAMLPSGVLSLLQIATVVITGLFLYAFVMLPLFIPVMVQMFGNANWWPFKK